MSGFLLLLPGGGGQLVDAVGWPLTQFGQHVLEIVPEIDVQTPAGFHDRGNRCDLRPGLFAADMQPVFATECQRTDRPFAPVMPPSDLCRVLKLEAHIPGYSNLIGYQRAA